ncbi:MAG: electron transport complex subunit RsxA [Bacilli bacterium]|nr:electron transport complex subunit RsxA [Bacilli bacterium]
MELIAIAFGAIFVNNVILQQFYGLCPFLGVSTKKSSALSMGMAVTFVITFSTIISYAIYTYILKPNDITYLSTIVFILVIASFVQLVEMFIKRFSSSLYSALGVYLPLITTNCAVLGVAIDTTVNSSKIFGGNENPTLMMVTIYALGISLGYALVIFLFSAIREEMSAYPIKRNWQGIPIALITAFIMAMIFIGFGGIV